MMSVVGCCWTFAVLLYTTWPTGLEGIDSITFEGTKPVPVLVGSNVTLSWTYFGQEDQIRIIFFSFLRDGELKKMARYTLSTNVPSTIDLGGYCDSVEWVGNTTKKIAAFRMNNISRLAHEETFAVDIYSGPNVKDFVDRQTISISGERNNGKRSTDVNAYAVFGIMVAFWSVFSSWLHVDSM